MRTPWPPEHGTVPRRYRWTQGAPASAMHVKGKQEPLSLYRVDWRG